MIRSLIVHSEKKPLQERWRESCWNVAWFISMIHCEGRGSQLQLFHLNFIPYIIYFLPHWEQNCISLCYVSGALNPGLSLLLYCFGPLPTHPKHEFISRQFHRRAAQERVARSIWSHNNHPFTNALHSSLAISHSFVDVPKPTEHNVPLTCKLIFNKAFYVPPHSSICPRMSVLSY